MEEGGSCLIASRAKRHINYLNANPHCLLFLFMKWHYKENAGPVIRNQHNNPYFAAKILIDTQNPSSYTPIVKRGVLSGEFKFKVHH